MARLFVSANGRQGLVRGPKAAPLTQNALDQHHVLMGHGNGWQICSRQGAFTIGDRDSRTSDACIAMGVQK